MGTVLGEGQFGTVRKAKVKETGRPVAMKIIPVPRLAEGVPHPVARELLISAHAVSPFLVETIEVVVYRSNMVLVMERCKTDLSSLLGRYSAFSPLPLRDVRRYIYMLLRGLLCLHQKGILHRDVKPANCFITSSGVLKLGDFGLSRMRSDDMSHEVVSRWYRAPELLFGLRAYDGEIDVWSVGCVFAELLRGYGSPLFSGDGDLNQLTKIFDVLGTPTETTYPGLSSLPDWEKVHFDSKEGTGLRSLVPRAPSTALQLLTSMLTINPSARCTVTEALEHPFFSAKDDTV